jgi:putative oxidoreductase
VLLQILSIEYIWKPFAAGPTGFSNSCQNNQSRFNSNNMKSKILFVLSLLFGLMFINAGLNKFFNYMPMPKDIPAESMKDFGAMMEISWLMPLLAIAEIIGGLLVIFTRTRALGAIVCFPVMVGILLANSCVDTSGLPIVLPMVAVLGWIIYENREKYLPMVR